MDVSLAKQRRYSVDFQGLEAHYYTCLNSNNSYWTVLSSEARLKPFETVVKGELLCLRCYYYCSARLTLPASFSFIYKYIIRVE